MQAVHPGSTTRRTIPLGILAGLAGATAEVLWIVVFAACSDSSAVEIAQAVARAASGGALDSVLAGVAIHMALGGALGLLLAWAWRTLPIPAGETSRLALTVVALAVVWKVNFFVVLPLVSPWFIGLMPLVVTLASKVLFGIAAGLVLRYGDASLRIA
jgi:hypothetical protein